MNSNINSTVSSVVSPIPDSWKDLKSPSPCFMNKNRADNVLNDKTNFITQHANKSKPMLARNIDNKPNIPHVLPICENELKLVPAYLKGRLTCSQINEVIDSINSVLEMKYSMIRKKFSQIKNTDKIIYNEWKEQDKLSLRGQYFITQSDLTTYGQIQMCKRNITILTILSNSRKIKKEHMKNNVKYTIVTS
ncbi:hypothetical protein M8J75_015546 [Diaphorina citri]|nr:hypothetical protein M8J75_015546 [Diaphorina citri]